MAAFQNLFTAYQTRDAWLAAEPEEMGLALLQDLKSTQNISPQNIRGLIQKRLLDVWGDLTYTDAGLDVVYEAYQWLRNVGLLSPSGRQPSDFDTLTRRALTLDDTGIANYLLASRSGYETLDPRIKDKVWGIYLRGDYDIAIAYAFKVVEVRMREKAGLTTNDMGEGLVKKVFAMFDSEARKKTEKSMPSTAHFFIGAFDRYRNTAVHEAPTITEPNEAMEVLLLSNHCLRIIERSEKPTSSA